jgi:hypothetical protein
MKWLAFLCLVALGAGICGAASPAENVPRAVLRKVVPLTSGDLLFAVRIYAPANRMLFLNGASGRKPDAENPPPFSLNGSTLTDVFSGAAFENRPSVPPEPFVGPMEILTSLNPGGWVQLGVAFPKPPPPPLKDGKKQPYQLLLRIPQLAIEAPLKLDPDTLQPL